MAINSHNPFKGRHHPGAVILSCVRWYLRYPLSYERVTELVAEHGVEVDASRTWRWCRRMHPEVLQPRQSRLARRQEAILTSSRVPKYPSLSVEVVPALGMSSCSGRRILGSLGGAICFRTGGAAWGGICRSSFLHLLEHERIGRYQHRFSALRPARCSSRQSALSKSIVFTEPPNTAGHQCGQESFLPTGN
jgi:hypothetical protein